MNYDELERRIEAQKLLLTWIMTQYEDEQEVLEILQSDLDTIKEQIK